MICRIAGLLSMMAFAALAQDTFEAQVVPLPGVISNDTVQMKQQLRQVLSQATVMGVTSAVMGPAVKGAPYSAIEIAENIQTLADGTHIGRKTQTNVYRDSEGRMRRETPEQVTIWDPIAGVSYFLDPTSQTGHKMTVGSYVGPGGGGISIAGVGGGHDIAYVTSGTFSASVPPPLPLPPPHFGAGPNMLFMTRDAQKLEGKSESLGNQTINGVNASGTRMTSTIDAGAIGNDRPIQIVSETWYSPELQTVVKSSHSDPRAGQDTFELSNLSRGEPGPDLFQAPAGYQMVGPK